MTNHKTVSKLTVRHKYGKRAAIVLELLLVVKTPQQVITWFNCNKMQVWRIGKTFREWNSWEDITAERAKHRK